MKFDALIIGGGRSGSAAGRALLSRGLHVCVVADGLHLGVDGADPYAHLNALAREGATVLRGDRALRGIWEEGRLRAVQTVKLEDEPIEASVFVLATGKFFSRGLLSDMERVYEPVFGADVSFLSGRSNWYAADFFAPQPFLDFGVQTDPEGHVLFGGVPCPNLYAVGGILAKGAAAADPARISLSTQD
ncbi:MAG: FAD-binding protein [Bacteroidales bacterium]|nr:FAD-binding protein [Bacteroidales bacterium]